MKRFIAILLTLSMALSLFAVPVSATGNEIVVGGTVVVVEHLGGVTIPTTPFTIAIDPEGVIPGNEAGDIVFGNATPSFINRGTEAILLGVEAVVTTSSDPATSVNIAATDTVGTASTQTRSAFISLTPSTDNVETSGDTFEGVANKTTLATTPTLFTFLLPGADFVIEGEFSTAGNVVRNELVRVLADPANLQGTQVALTGKVTPNPAIWEDAAISVALRWSFIPASTAVAEALVGPVPNSAHLLSIRTNTPIADLNVFRAPPTFAVTVVSESATGASESGSFAVGTEVSINAGTRDGFNFNGWTATPAVSFASASSASTTFTMPAEAVTVTANWEEVPSGPSVAASLNAAGSVLTIDATNFEFRTGTWTVQGFSTRDNNLITLAAAAGAVSRVSATQLTVTFNAAWSNSGIHQGAGATHFIITNGNQSIRVNKPNGNASPISGATITIS